MKPMKSKNPGRRASVYQGFGMFVISIPQKGKEMNSQSIRFDEVSIVKEKLEAIEGKVTLILAGKEAERELNQMVNELQEEYGIILKF